MKTGCTADVTSIGRAGEHMSTIHGSEVYNGNLSLFF
ncbi:MAG: hypothetical protein A4E48_01751 [Methanosaeta sp. PtaU1.Bin060]|nr:MAG: hypothetical protein A4E48_01751 [Methanosaeta sp. PtaU1.Bin060]